MGVTEVFNVVYSCHLPFLAH